MKKKITALCLCVALLAVAVVGASLAYFTDTKSATNTFTVGNVKIDLLESSLHRENAGVANGATSTSELWSDVAKEGTGNISAHDYMRGEYAAWGDWTDSDYVTIVAPGKALALTWINFVSERYRSTHSS